MLAGVISVIVPAYNEQATVAEVIAAVCAVPAKLEVIVVENGSTDRTREIVEEIAAQNDAVKVIVMPVNRGKGAGVRAGLAAATGDVVVIQDADLEYDPEDIPRLVEPIFDGKADAVYGTRLRGGGQPQRAHLFWHYVGNRFLSTVTNVLYNTTISDVEVGYKAFRTDLIQSLELFRDDFGIEPEITAKLLRRGGVRLYEIPISYYGRSYAEGKKITWRDGFVALWILFRERFA